MTNSFINYLLESGIALALFYLVYRIVLAGGSQFRLNRAYLMAGMLFSMVLPMMTFPVDQGATLLQYRQVLTEPVMITLADTQDTSVNHTHPLWIYLYQAGFIILLALFLQKIIRVIQLGQKGRMVNYGNYSIIEMEEEILPFSFFNRIFIKERDFRDPNTSRFILEHELVHVRHYHSVDNLLVGLVTLVHWFNPFIWLIYKELKKVHEFEADRRTIVTTGNYKGYQALLFQQAFGVSYLSPINNFNSSIKKRLLMLRKSSSTVDFVKGFIFIPLVIALIFVFACSETNNSGQGEKAEDVELKAQAKGSETEDEVFIAVEEMPRFQGGSVKDFRFYVQKQLTYPKEAAEKGLEGTSFISFIVNQEGELEDVKVIRGSHSILDQAAMDAIKDSPSWEPGKQRGEKVNVKFTIPVVFKLSKESGTTSGT